MRKIMLAAAVSFSALALTACSDAAEETTETPEAEATETAEAVEAAGVLNGSNATADELTAAGLTPELAAAIVAGQPYASVTDLNAVLLANGTPEEATATLVNVFVPINLNTFTDEEVALVPGIDGRMMHEFDEYRPYKNLEEFDREIGKYVDEAEVARFRQYVTL
jgi:DNA uptake protein ComE-like DNA-binding protein